MKRFVYYPFLIAIFIVLGIFIGYNLQHNDNKKANHKEFLFSLPFSNQQDKLKELIDLIETEYVDTVNLQELTDYAIYKLLEQLDPHSSYIPKEEIQAMNEPLEGNFEGIGIEFNIFKDTISVISVIVGGPSEKVGIKPGDKIIKVDNKPMAGVKIKNKDVIKTLRGKKGSKVKVSILRNNEPQLLDFEIIRDKIPLHSIDAAYMLDETHHIGYIKISRFAATTHAEFETAMKTLKKKGMNKLVLDLRGNSGGYLQAAIDIADEFLSENQLIVYTQGRNRPKKVAYATAKGSFDKGKVCVLIDEGSASASEIVAGALQDNDKAIIVGRRSFGKGLVQEEFMFHDSSAVRLTIARYYTPTGRSIQKPYNNGLKAYFKELNDRYEHGELQTPDTTKNADSLKFTTPKGKIVYGGGGISPDVFVPLDTTYYSDFLVKLYQKNIINEYVFNYTNQYKEQLLKKYPEFESYQKNYVLGNQVLNGLIIAAKEAGIKETNLKPATKAFLQKLLKANIAKGLYNEYAYYAILQEDDKAIKEAIKILLKQ